MAVSLVLPFELSGASVVEDDSEEGTGIRSEFSHLLLEVTVVVSWESFDGFGDGGQFTHENEHVLGQVLGDGSDSAEFLVTAALLHDVENGLLEVASAQVLQDFGTLGEEVEVLVDVSTGDDRHWVSNDTVEGDNVVNSLIVEAFSIVLAQMRRLIEGFVVTLVESLDSVDVPDGISLLLLIGFVGGVEDSLNFYGIGGSKHGSESEGSVRFHFLSYYKLIILNTFLFSYNYNQNRRLK